MTTKDGIINSLKKALEELDYTSSLRLTLIQTIEYLQEEPVSKVWHDMIEEAENGRNIIIIDPKDFYGAVLRKGGTQLKNHNKERYVKWAYIDDIINVTNKEEPVSEDLEQAIDTYLSTYFGGEKEKQEWPFLKKMAIYFAEWQKQKDSIPVSEDLKEEVIKKVLYFSENFHKAPWAIDSTGAVMPIWYAKFGAKWQKEKEYTCYEEAFEDGAKWKVENLWKPADGDDLKDETNDM